MTRFTPEEVETKYGLTPAQYPDFAALRGDPSDNLPSIPSVGEKTAAKWVREYGSLDALVDQVDTVKGKVGEKLREHLSSVMQNRRLTELDRAVPLELGPADLAVQPWDRNEVHTLFDNLQFRVLRDRLFATLTSAEPEVEGGFDVAEDDVPAGGLGEWLQANARTGRTGLIFRGTWGRGTGELTGIALAAANDHATFVDVGPDLDVADEQALAAWLADPATQKVVHEGKGPYLAIWARGWELEGVVSDTALAAYLANPGQRSFDLGDLAVRYLKRELKDAAEPEGQLTLDGLGPERGRRRRRGRARRRPQGRGRQRPLRRPRDGARPARRGRPARRHRAAADPGAGRHGVPRHRRRRRLPAGAAAGVRRRRLRRRRRVLRRHRPRGEPRVAQAAAGGDLRRAGPAQDQEEQDRLHDGRRRADLAARADRPPVHGAPAPPPRRHPAAHGHRRAAADGRRRRPHPHDVPADDRGDRPALLDRPEPAEHPDPHRRGPPHPSGVRRRHRATSR